MYPLLLLETEELEARKVDAKNWPFSFKYFHKIYHKMTSLKSLQVAIDLIDLYCSLDWPCYCSFNSLGLY